MSFFDRQYSVFLTLAGATAAPIWSTPVWTQFAQALDPYMSSGRGRASTRTTQYSDDRKPVNFGRLGWDAKSHGKWTQSPQQAERVLFVHAEAWAPSWNQCERDNLAPDFFLAVANERALARAERALQFSQRIICAISQDRGSIQLAQLECTMGEWAKKLDALLFARISRPWGFASGAGFSGAIQDLLVSGLFKPGSPHEREPNLASLAENWENVQ
jgi:hypothetical protein